MKAFKCKKCGNEKEEEFYIQHQFWGDQLKVKCQRCDYLWYEEPLEKNEANPQD